MELKPKITILVSREQNHLSRRIKSPWKTEDHGKGFEHTEKNNSVTAVSPLHRLSLGKFRIDLFP